MSSRWSDPFSRAETYRRDTERRELEANLSRAERKQLALEDLATYRTVSFADLCEARFGGDEAAARRAVSQMEAAGLLVRGTGRGPKGGEFPALAATEAGRREVRRRSPPGQRLWHGLAKPREAHRDTAVYRAAVEKIKELQARDCHNIRVRVAAGLRRDLAKAGERARATGGAAAARRARLARAEELGLTVKDGKVRIPDMQIEYSRADLSVGNFTVEAVTGTTAARMRARRKREAAAHERWERRERGSRRDRGRRRQEPKLSWAERKRLALEDLGTYRTVSFADLCEARFGGNEFAARRAVSQMQAAGLLVRGQGRGPKGGEFLVLALTEAGRREVRRRSPPGQRLWHGLAKPREAHHDTAIYRVALKKIAGLEARGFRILRVRIDAELKGELAKASEKARAAEGPTAARRARLARAKELGVPAKNGKVLIPDMQIEYERPDLSLGIASVEVVTGSYRNGSVRAKAAAGFSLAASGELGRKRIEAAMGSAGASAPRPDLGETEGRGGIRDVEEWEW